MASCLPPTTSFSVGTTTITETRTTTVLQTVTVPVRKKRAPQVEILPTPVWAASNAYLIRRQDTPTLDPSLPTGSLSTETEDQASPTGSNSPQSPSEPPTSTQTSSPTATSQSSTSSQPGSSTRSGSSVSVLTQVSVVTTVRTEVTSVPAIITPPCSTNVLPTSSNVPLTSVPLSTYVAGTSSGLLSSVYVTTVVTSGGSRSTLVTAVPTLISFTAENSTSGLKPGAVAGIVIGTLAVLAALTVFACIFRRRRQRQEKAGEMIERVTIGRMLESEGFDEPPNRSFRPGHSVSTAGYGSYDYGIVGSSIRKETAHSIDSTRESSYAHNQVYSQDQHARSSGVELATSSNIAANKRAIAARASGSSSGSIFRENFETGGEDGDQARGPPRSSPTPITGHGTHGGSVHEPLIGGHQRFSSLSGKQSGSPTNSPHRGPPGLNRPKEPPPISFPYSLQARMQQEAAGGPRGITYPPPSQPQVNAWASSSLPPGAGVPPPPQRGMNLPRPNQGPVHDINTPISSTTNNTQSTEPYLFLPDAHDSLRLPRLSTDNASFMEDSELSRHVVTDPSGNRVVTGRLVEYSPDSLTFPPLR